MLFMQEFDWKNNVDNREQKQKLAKRIAKRAKEGDTIGKVAKPTKYYSEEGSNLYFQVMEKDKSVDPLLLLR